MTCRFIEIITDKIKWLKTKFFSLFRRERKSIPIYENLTEFSNIYFNDIENLEDMEDMEDMEDKEDMEDTRILKDIYFGNESYISYDNNLEFSDI